MSDHLREGFSMTPPDRHSVYSRRHRPTFDTRPECPSREEAKTLPSALLPGIIRVHLGCCTNRDVTSSCRVCRKTMR